MINRNALLIIIITLTCAFLVEKEGGGDGFFSFSLFLTQSLSLCVCAPDPKKSVEESEEQICVCNSPPLMVAPCRGASKQSRNTSTPTSPRRWEMVSFTHGKARGFRSPIGRN